MIDVSNRVLTNVKTYISDICQNVQSDSTKTPPSFPSVSVVQIDNPDTAVDLENSENAVESVIEIQSFSNKNITESKTIINKACDSMRIMGYVRAYGPQKISNTSDTNINRMVARFKRIVSSVDEIEKFT
ncbi:Uncharacterised protein [[Eubacterium] contortum]|uniref:Uncharacterized protein n=1 Tax=Faecalicatena contorta TaxID=39482 RepID=A0A174JR82_9FIRM|nr:hypothetical protein [Faecalicatena contorta]CUO99670.1 Uncharacterised protein [[Eubacterium] contortum] [Faecalicatena contorta]